MPKYEQLLCPSPAGLYCPPGDFYIDPVRPVDRAVITHGHGDHARAGHGTVLATRETLAIMGRAMARISPRATQAARLWRDREQVNDVSVTLAPAGHVLGSAQAVVRWKGMTMVVSGDYKRRRDPTCPPFEPVPCDVFITEATFGLPVFRHPPDTRRDRQAAEIGGAVPRAHPSGRRLCAGQGAADHLPAARGRLRQDDLCAWRVGEAERAVRTFGVDLGPLAPATTGQEGRTSPAQSSSRRRPRRRTAGRGAFPIRWRASPRAGCGCARGPASAASNCR